MSELQLNEPGRYKEYSRQTGLSGRIIDMMPLLVAEGRTPLSVAGLMQRRLDVLNASEVVKGSWWNNYFDTADAIAYHPDGHVKIVPDAQALRTLTAQSTIRDGALVLEDGMYESLEGVELTREDLGKLGTPLSRKEARRHPVWNALARGNASLLESYTDAAFDQAKERFQYDSNMSIYVASTPSVPTVRSWFVDRLGNGSCAIGNGPLVINGGRLVGVAPEAQSREK